VKLSYDRNGKSSGTAIVCNIEISPTYGIEACFSQVKFKGLIDAQKCIREHQGLVVDDLEMVVYHACVMIII